MENGHEERLADKFLRVGLDDSSHSPGDGSLLQVIKAVEAAETTIKQQVSSVLSLRLLFEIVTITSSISPFPRLLCKFLYCHVSLLTNKHLPLHSDGLILV